MKVLAIAIVLCSISSILAINMLNARIKGISKINSLRALHVNTTALTLNSTLDAMAQNHCDDLAKQTVGGVPKLFRTNFTNNVFMGETMFGSKTLPFDEQAIATAAQSWYDEIKVYNYSWPNYDNKYVNFTQLVWKDTTQVGLGMSQVGDVTYVCAMYDPYGNRFCLFAQKVMPLKA